MAMIYATCENTKFKIDKYFYLEVLEECKIDCDRVFCPKGISCSECPLGDEELHKIESFEIQ